jgi:hypothetical protein
VGGDALNPQLCVLLTARLQLERLPFAEVQHKSLPRPVAVDLRDVGHVIDAFEVDLTSASRGRLCLVVLEVVTFEAEPSLMELLHQARSGPFP